MRKTPRFLLPPFGVDFPARGRASARRHRAEAPIPHAGAKALRRGKWGQAQAESVPIF